MNHCVSIGNTSAVEFAAWTRAYRETWFAFTAIDGVGAFGDVIESCVVVTLYDVREHEAREILRRYGRSHSGEECFGLWRAPDSALVPNASHV